MSDAPNVYMENGVIIVRASAFGSCDLKLWAVYDGVQPMEHSDMTKRAFKEGHLHEEAMRQELTEDGYKMTGDQEEVVLKILPNRLHIVGHIDGFVKLGTSSQFDSIQYGDERLWEAKAMSRNAFEDWVRDTFNYRPGYAWQLAIYMLGTGKDTAHYSVKRRDDGLIQNWLIDELPKSKSEIRSRALHLYKMFTSGEMPECNAASSGEKWFCEYWFLHAEDDVPLEDPELPADNVPELDNDLAAYFEVNETEKWAKAEKKRLKEKIQNDFRNGRDKFGSDNFKVGITNVHSSRFDKTQLIVDEGQEFVDKYTKKITYERWDVEPRKG